MAKYKFKAKDLRTKNWVEGDLLYAEQFYRGKPIIIRPMIVKFKIHGGIMWPENKYFIDENTIELIKEE